MKTITVIALLSPFIAFSQYHLGEKYLVYNSSATAAELKTLTFENLRLYPIMARDSFKLAFKNLTRYTPLKRALIEKKIVITEKEKGGDVNDLIIENKSKDTIIVNCGEVIKGGQQDRVISKDIVLYPRSGKKNLPVFCVEPGRWTPRNGVPGISSRQGKPSPAAFRDYYNYGAESLRKVVTKDADQGKVWSKVHEINDQNKTETASGTYTALEQSANYRSKMNDYVSFFAARISREPDIVGVIIATGNRVIGADIFATHDLFIQNFDGLLHSYVTEAILKGAPVTIMQSTVNKYVSDLLGDEKKQEETLKLKGSKFEDKGKKIRISSFD